MHNRLLFRTRLYILTSIALVIFFIAMPILLRGDFLGQLYAWLAFSLVYLATAHWSVTNILRCCWTTWQETFSRAMLAPLLILLLSGVRYLNLDHSEILAQDVFLRTMELSFVIPSLLYAMAWLWLVGKKFTTPQDHLVEINNQPCFPGYSFYLGPFFYPKILNIAHPEQELSQIECKIFTAEGAYNAVLTPYVTIDVESAEQAGLQHLDIARLFQSVQAQISEIILKQPDDTSLIRTLKKIPLGVGQNICGVPLTITKIEAQVLLH